MEISLRRWRRERNWDPTFSEFEGSNSLEGATPKSNCLIENTREFLTAAFSPIDRFVARFRTIQVRPKDLGGIRQLYL
jgi:hypothetical protein